MNRNVLYAIVIVISLTFMAGCTSGPSPGSPSPAPSQVPSPVPSVPLVTVTGTQTPAPLMSSSDTRPVQTTSPGPSLSPVRTIMPDRTQEPLVAFRDVVLLSLDNLQSAKEGLLLTYRTGDMARVQQKAEEFSLMVRRSSELSNVPTKMDYVRLNYYDYIDQTGQYAKSFKDGADRYLASDKASATSLFEAGIMAADRADISDKRIRTFLSEHVFQVQINQT
nr:hypothetical protein [uncultured Methanospirillum sp.]